MRTSALATLALLLLPLAAAAQPMRMEGPGLLTPPLRHAVVDRLSVLMRSEYVDPEVGDRAAARIEARFNTGAYDAAATGAAFGAQLTADLDEVTHDKHLRVFAGDGPPPDGRAGPPLRSLGGVTRADRLAGNVGYIDLFAFPAPLSVFRAGVDKAMAAVATTRALVIDLRHNPGGDAESVRYLESWFLDGAKPRHISDMIWRTAGETGFRTEEFWSVPTPGKYLGKPVIVLTSRDTFSGAEAFAYDMQAMKLAVVIGETTGGGAHPGGMRPLPGGLMVFLPSGRSLNLITKTNWEGTGVAPDQATPAEEALRAALLRLGLSPAAATPDALSEARLLVPPTSPQPGAEAALRRYLAAVGKGALPQAELSPDWLKEARDDLPGERERLSDLGALRAVSFREVGMFGDNIYDLTFARGTARWMILLADDGKVAAAFPLM